MNVFSLDHVLLVWEEPTVTPWPCCSSGSKGWVEVGGYSLPQHFD